jgi:hypothetical protein
VLNHNDGSRKFAGQVLQEGDQRVNSPGGSSDHHDVKGCMEMLLLIWVVAQHRKMPALYVRGST